MNCKTLHKDLIFFLEGDLPAKKMEQIETHLHECSSCAAFAEEMKKTLGTIEVEKSVDVNPFFYTRVKAKLENSKSETMSVFSRSVLVKVLQPALFSLLLIFGIYGGIKIGQPSQAEIFSSTQFDKETIPYLNEMETETIETFLME